MNGVELDQCRVLLGVTPTTTVEELERAFMKKNFALIKGNTGDEPKRNVEAEREQLRSAHERLAEHVKAQIASAPKGPRLATGSGPDRAAADAAWASRSPGQSGLSAP